MLRTLNATLSNLPAPALRLFIRIFPALVFLQSGRTKLDGLSIKDSTYFLFEHEYALPVIPPEIAAVLATTAEHVFPVLILFGLFTRLSAMALIGMTVVIQIFVYPDAWVTHGLWIAALLAIVANGPGRWSVDFLAGLDR